MRKNWHMSHDRDGFAVQLTEEAWWVAPYETVIGGIDKVTGCWLCGAKLPGWMWSLRVAPGGDVEETEDVRWLENSLASKWWNVSQRIFLFPLKGVKNLERIRVSNEVGKKLWPRNDEMLAMLLDEDEDEDKN